MKFSREEVRPFVGLHRKWYRHKEGLRLRLETRRRVCINLELYLHDAISLRLCGGSYFYEMDKRIRLYEGTLDGGLNSLFFSLYRDIEAVCLEFLLERLLECFN